MMDIKSKILELENYLPPLTKQADFDGFWKKTLEETKKVPLNPKREKIEYPSEHISVYDVSYCGFDKTEIKAWLLVPSFLKKETYPCLIQYHGFGGNRHMPSSYSHWLLAGLCVLAIDCRAQSGLTGNQATYHSGLVNNVGSLGILDKDEYYYRAVYMDCVKAIDFAQTCEEVDPSKIIIRGTSQGGALGMAVCALDPRPSLALVNVPSNSNIERRVIGRHGSFACINDFLRIYPDKIESVFQTLSYFDTMNMADKITCEVYASVALADPVCPAICYYASYNRIQSQKNIEIYPFNEHDGAGDFHLEKELAAIQKYLF